MTCTGTGTEHVVNVNNYDASIKKMYRYNCLNEQITGSQLHLRLHAEIACYTSYYYDIIIIPCYSNIRPICIIIFIYNFSCRRVIPYR